MTGTSRLEGELAVVTGGAHGIGRAVVERFAREGAAVGIIDVDGSGAVGAAAEIARRTGRGVGVAADVSDPSAVRAALASIVRSLGRPTVLVNNAGIRGFVSLLAEDAEAIWHRVLAVNLTGMY